MIDLTDISTSPPFVVANFLEMLRTKPDAHSFVLVEGKTDRRLWMEYKASKCRLFYFNGRSTVMRILREANRRPLLTGVAAIVDPDFWFIEQSPCLREPNLLYDDSRDLEFTLLDSPALEKVFRHTLNLEDVSQLTDSVRRDSITLAIEFGYFGLVHHRHPEYSLRISKVSFAEVINAKTRKLDSDLVADRMSKCSTISKEELLSHVASVRKEIGPRLDLCKGDDVLAIVSYILSVDTELSDKSRVQTLSSELSRTLKIAYEFVYFVCTELYKRIRDWESNNGCYRIIKDFPLERTPPHDNATPHHGASTS